MFQNKKGNEYTQNGVHEKKISVQSVKSQLYSLNSLLDQLLSLNENNDAPFKSEDYWINISKYSKLPKDQLGNVSFKEISKFRKIYNPKLKLLMKEIKS